MLTADFFITMKVSRKKRKREREEERGREREKIHHLTQSKVALKYLNQKERKKKINEHKITQIAIVWRF